MSPFPTSGPKTIAIWDRDHVLEVARLILMDPSHHYIRDFFAPELVDPEYLVALGRELRTCDGWQVVQCDQAVAPPRSTEAIILRRGRITRDMIDACPNLRAIVKLGERTDGIDTEYASRRNIFVHCQPRPSLIMVAEHVITLVLGLSKRILEADRLVRRGGVEGSIGIAHYNWPGLTHIAPVQGRTLGVIGPGEVGALVASKADNLGMKILYCGREESSARLPVGTLVPLEELLSRSDVVTLHVKPIKGEPPLIDGNRLALMRRGSFLINTSRGELIDEAALAKALYSGHCYGAGLDVHRHEPRALDDPLLQAPNLLLTPHVAAGSRLLVLEEIASMFEAIRGVSRVFPDAHASPKS